MMLRLTVLLSAFSIVFSGCSDKTVDLGTNACKGSPLFVKRLAGFNTARSWFSTSEIRMMGLVLVENLGKADAPRLRYYQHPSWKMAGWLSPIQLDEQGNVFTAPAPFINVLSNPVESQNTLYKVDALTGEMKLFVSLPLPDTVAQNNPYGIIGIDYLCDAGVLYISSIAGSDRRAERGGIYAVDAKTARIMDEIHGYDAMGIGVSNAAGKRQLIFGTGRSSQLYVIDLNENGTFNGTIQPVFSLEGLGPRGDDRVRKITINGQGHLQIHGIEFNYNLIAPREKQETVYEFYFNPATMNWEYLGIS